MTRNNATEINLPGSKSISNRALILAYLHGIPIENIQGLSDSRDTQLLKNALSELESESADVSVTLGASDTRDTSNTTSRPITIDASVALPIFDFMDAGTPSRFFLALCALLGKPCIITGNESLQNRSIEALVNVLSFGGCEIQYLNQPGFFPVQLLRREHSLEIATNPLKIAINRSISSQFVSAIMLISCRLIGKNKYNPNSTATAPFEKEITSTDFDHFIEKLTGDQDSLPHKFATTLPLHHENFRVEIELLGHAHSDSYIEMTASVMRDFGYQVEIKDGFISIYGNYNGIQEYTIEADWSSLSYFLNQLLIGENISEISFKHLRSDSYQGDRKKISFYEELGLEFQFHEDQLLVRNKLVSYRNTECTPTENLNTDIEINPMDSTNRNTESTPSVHSHSGSTPPRHIDFDWDLSDIPDTVPSLVVALAALKKSAYLRNIHNLIYKESNRIAVLNENLIRFGFQLIQDDQAPNNYWLIPNSRHWRSEKQEFVVLNNSDKHTDTITVNFENSHGILENEVLKKEETDPLKIQPYRTHSDHRMAMAFASITKLTELITLNPDLEHELISNWVDDPSCVEKSFPNFWQELQKMVG
jgi:5-enolpyruvylshikimate-3-phosphate synthase